jgi:hypothetical protein
MENLKKLNRSEMKSVMGGKVIPPITCDSGTVLSVCDTEFIPGMCGCFPPQYGCAPVDSCGLAPL